jgi:hypothetical protein
MVVLSQALGFLETAMREMTCHNQEIDDADWP